MGHRTMASLVSPTPEELARLERAVRRAEREHRSRGNHRSRANLDTAKEELQAAQQRAEEVIANMERTLDHDVANVAKHFGDESSLDAVVVMPEAFTAIRFYYQNLDGRDSRFIEVDLPTPAIKIEEITQVTDKKVDAHLTDSDGNSFVVNLFNNSGSRARVRDVTLEKP